MTVCVVRRQESYQRDVRLSSNSLYKRAGSYIIGRLEVSYVQQRFDKWDISCRISKQGYHNHQRLQPPLDSEPVSPEGTQVVKTQDTGL